MKLKTALIQMDITSGEPDSNRVTAEERIRRAANDGAAVVILPEMWTTAYSLHNISEIADRGGVPTAELLSRLAMELGICLIGGSFADQIGDRVYNTTRVFSPEGRELARYSKIHLFRLMDEEKYLTPGDRPATFRWGDLCGGLMICYDLRFPELSRTLALAGANVLFCPAEWPHPRLHHWRTLLQARAIENQAYVIGCNRVGRSGDTVFFGHSMVVNPWGEILAEGGENEEIILAEIDLDLVQSVRQRIPVFKDRVPGAYGLL